MKVLWGVKISVKTVVSVKELTGAWSNCWQPAFPTYLYCSLQRDSINRWWWLMGVGGGSCWADRLGKYLWQFFCWLDVINFQFSSSSTVQKISILWTYYGITFCIHSIIYTVLMQQHDNNNHITHALFSSNGCTICFIKLHSLCINIISKNICTVLLFLPYGIHFFFFNYQVPLSPLLIQICNILLQADYIMGYLRVSIH